MKYWFMLLHGWNSEAAEWKKPDPQIHTLRCNVQSRKIRTDRKQISVGQELGDDETGVMV